MSDKNTECKTCARALHLAGNKVKSEELFKSCACHELIILHEGEQYKLRLTVNNKLILTK